MNIIIRRNNSILAGAMIKSKVWVNGELAGKVAHGEEKEMTIPDNNTELQVRQFTGKSNKLVVSAGDRVEISDTPWLLWIFIFVVMVGTSFQLLNLTRTPVFYVTMLLLFLVLYRGINLFRLTKRHSIQS